MAHVSDHAVFHHFICQFKNGFGIEWKHFHGLAIITVNGSIVSGWPLLTYVSMTKNVNINPPESVTQQ